MVDFGKLLKGDNMKKKDSLVDQSVDSSVPAFIPQGDARGTEHLTREDVQMPRLTVAQGLSPQLIEADPTFIEGLKIGDMFNVLTGHIFGKGPLVFTVVRADPPRGVEFIPRKEGGGIRDFNVPLNDPRMQFADGNTPIATKFYDFVILLLPSKEVLAISFKSMSLKVAKQLNMLMKLRRIPIFGGKYTFTSQMDKNAKGTFAILRVQNAGCIEDEKMYIFAEQTFEAVKYRDLQPEAEVNVEESPEGPTPF